MGAILVTILDAVTRWAAAPILLDVNLIVVLGESRRVLFFARTGIAVNQPPILIRLLMPIVSTLDMQSPNR